MKIKVGVDVSDVLFDGRCYAPGRAALAGAKLYLEGETPPFPGPIFDSRNNIVGSDDNMMFVVNPFQLAIRGKDVEIHATDHLNPARPEQPIWQMEDPSIYARRLPTNFTSSSTAVMAAIRVFDGYSYFRDRRRFLEQRIVELERTLAPGAVSLGAAERAAVEGRIQGLRTRIFQLELWGDRVITKLAFQLTYSFTSTARSGSSARSASAARSIAAIPGRSASGSAVGTATCWSATCRAASRCPSDQQRVPRLATIGAAAD